MQPQQNKHRTTDYTHQLRPRRHSMDGLSVSKPVPVSYHEPIFKPYSKPAAGHSKDEEYRVSISINLPDYNRWRLTKFARQYPYLSLGLAVLGLLGLALFMEGLVTLWHALHHHKAVPAVILMPRILQP